MTMTGKKNLWQEALEEIQEAIAVDGDGSTITLDADGRGISGVTRGLPGKTFCLNWGPDFAGCKVTLDSEPVGALDSDGCFHRPWVKREATWNVREPN